MNKVARRDWWFTGLLFITAALIKIIAYNRSFVEIWYSQKWYVYISRFFRFLFGWLPFSFGDILYGAVFTWLLFQIIKLIIALFKKQYSKRSFINGCRKTIRAALIIYILFNILWGLNYDRRGIAYVLNLTMDNESGEDLNFLADSLLNKVNSARNELPDQYDSLSADACYNKAISAYNNLSYQQSIFSYQRRSIKSSLYGLLGNYLGYSGYYNPFTGEAQINVKMPSFLLPYITCHEMAHQLGYASEDEANFVGYLAAKSSTDARVRYSVYFDLFNYANGELYLYDSTKARSNYKQLDTLVKKDIKAYRRFLLKYENPLEPLITSLYGTYLKANSQPEGIRTYSRVTALLIAYEKKYHRL